jgi:hypothetical protein
MVETGIKAQLVDQVNNVTGTSKSVLGTGKQLTGAQLSSGAMTSAGALKLGRELANTLTVTNLENATINAEAVVLRTNTTSNSTQQTVQDVQDVISMPGGAGRVLTGPFGAFSLDKRDMVMAGDPNKMMGSSNGGADLSQLTNIFMQVGNMMVSAINSQTQQLKADNLFSPGMNGPTWG